jgi:molybdopterin converting factor small subunit
VQVEVQLHATLTPFLPPGSRDGVARIELPEHSTIAALIDRLAIPADLSRVVLVNGHDVEDDAALHAGDVVDVFPPLAGGAGSGWYTRTAFGSV